MRRSTSAPRPRRRSSATRRKEPLPPFPVQQMFVLACCRLCEPIAFMSIFPYIYYMIEDFKITEDPNKISVYAGMVTSAFTLAEFATGVLWGKLSDKIGRKPVLLSGLIGTAISVVIFGFAPSLPVALFARAMGGLLNGNIGVLQTTVAELVTVKEHQPRAYTIMPMVWCIGSIIGPMIGGALARPCISYPDYFPRGSIWDHYPYLLPNLFSAATVLFGVIVGILFLEETHLGKKGDKDRGRQIGDRIASLFSRATHGRADKPEKQSLLGDGQHTGYDSLPGPSTPDVTKISRGRERLPDYRSRETSPRMSSQVNAACHVVSNTESSGMQPDQPTEIFTKPVVMNIISYGILAFHTITYDQLFPVFLSTAPPKEPILELPFKFVNGFGLETKAIGVIISVQGFYSLLSNYLIVTPITRRLGPLRLFRLIAFSYFALYLVTPYVVLLPESLRMPAIYLLVIWKCTFSTMAYPSNAILLANSAPTKQVLGTINGVAASTASLCRALGPTISGFLYAMGLQSGYSGLAWWFSGLVTIAGAYLSSQITEGTQPPVSGEMIETDDSLVNDYDDDESV
ncbi:major facilitator superfamily domain-containing protein [Trichoderma ceciliae]